MTGTDVRLVGPDPSIGSKIKESRSCVTVLPADLHDDRRAVLGTPIATGTHLTAKLGTVSAKTLDTTLGTLQQVFAV